MKLHLALGRMNIDIDSSGIDFQKQAANRIATFHQGGVIAFQQREIEAAIFNRAPIDE